MAKEKIAILGAGVGAMSAAFEITSQPGWQDRYDITVYQLGWRVGGKGASGRNQAIANRIQEHGLHLWMGFYENAFDVIRQAYQYCRENNLTPGTPFPTYQQAFSHMNFTALGDLAGDNWKVWPIVWCQNNDIPGQPNPTDAAPPTDGTPWSYVVALIDFARSHLDRLMDHVPVLQGMLDNLVDDVMAFEEYNPAGGRNTLLHRIAVFTKQAAADVCGRDELDAIGDSLAFFLKALFDALEAICREDDNIRRDLTILDTALAIVIGMIRDEVLSKGFDAIEELDFIEWLRGHGCHFALSALTRGMYDAAFGYRGGDPGQLCMAAGSTLHGALRLMFTYRGSIMWWMNAGMGDTIFTPIYKALSHRGVKFEFFRKVTRIAPSAGGKSVGTIEMDIQAHVKPDLPNGYDPLVPVNNLLCWPSLPPYEQLVEGETLQDPKYVNRDLESWWNDLPAFGKIVLKQGQDFDRVILGISLGALPYICKDLIAADATGGWKNMVGNLQAIRTQAFQVWLNQTESQMGWNPACKQAPILGGYVEYYDTWADMTHLIPRESWNAADNVQQIAYFCDVSPFDPNQQPFSDPGYPGTQAPIPFNNAQQFLNRYAPLLWPLARDPGNPCRFNWNLLVNRTGTAGPDALASQYFRINIDPSELYIVALPGTKKYRLAPWDARFDNLILAGDWTLNNLNLGCVEAAVQSGKGASYALTGAPDFIYGSYRRQIPIRDAIR